MMMRRDRRKERGVSAIEFALAMPILFVVLFGVFEFGMAFWRKQMLTSAVREGARYGVVASPRKSLSEIQTKVNNYMDGVGLTDGARTVTATGAPCAASGSNLVVTATYPTSLSIMSNLTKLFWGSTSLSASKTLSAS